MQRNIKILFVCHGNICRSPICEFVFKDIAIKAGYSVAGIGGASFDDADFDVASAATSREELGNPIYPPAKKILIAHGIGTPDKELGVSGKRARQMTREDYAYYDMIILMDKNNMRNALRLLGGDPDGKLKMLLDFAGRPGEEVADPWYTGDFDATWEDAWAGCEGLLASLR